MLEDRQIHYSFYKEGRFGSVAFSNAEHVTEDATSVTCASRAEWHMARVLLIAGGGYPRTRKEINHEIQIHA
jgi:hypothetical protein